MVLGSGGKRATENYTPGFFLVFFMVHLQSLYDFYICHVHTRYDGNSSYSFDATSSSDFSLCLFWIKPETFLSFKKFPGVWDIYVS